MSGNYVVLCPVDPSVEIDLQAVIEYLQKVEFIGAPCQPSWSKDERSYWSTGKRFSEFFRNENQQSQTAAQPNDIWSASHPVGNCDVKIVESLDFISVATSPLIERLEEKGFRCPACGQAIEGEPVDLISAWWGDAKLPNLQAQIQYRWRCSNCGTAHKIWELDWAEVVGFYRYFIEFDDLWRYGYDIEDSLWTVLHEASGVDWHPIWVHI